MEANSVFSISDMLNRRYIYHVPFFFFRELPGENFYLNTCMECPKNYPWLKDFTGNGFAL